MDHSELENKLLDIDTRMAYQDDSIQALSDVVYKQQQQIDHLNKLTQLLVDKVKDLSEHAPHPHQEEKPPHY